MADTYKITSVRPKVLAVPGGLFQNVMAVTFTTIPHEQTGTVDIPDQAFTDAEVDKVVRAKAALIESVMGL